MHHGRPNTLTSIFKGRTELVGSCQLYFLEVTKDNHYAHLYIDLTQTRDDRARYLSNLWGPGPVETYVMN